MLMTPYLTIDTELRSKLKNIKALLSDVDGVLSNGYIYLGNDGNEYKTFNVKDGCGIVTIQKYGIKFGVITGRKSKIVEERMKSLKVEIVYQGVGEKLSSLQQIMSDYNLKAEEIAYIGDDVIDIPVFEEVGFSACPMDAHPYAKENCNYVCKLNGGEGAVREICDLIMLAQNINVFTPEKSL
jgi:3-deoxy-D-manno-octulosonate 8-phosphate phosphatase (KDO 8-P phosphatase)